MASKKKASKKKVGVLMSVYFHNEKELRRVRQAAKVKGIRMSALMRDAILTASEKIIVKRRKVVTA